MKAGQVCHPSRTAVDSTHKATTARAAAKVCLAKNIFNEKWFIACVARQVAEQIARSVNLINPFCPDSSSRAFRHTLSLIISVAGDSHDIGRALQDITRADIARRVS